ncbi:MAG: transcriptional repressor [Acidimicrobiaceae bacterium]|nr:transcriptional repressor [Acidimicrobiaceae bacterium]
MHSSPVDQLREHGLSVTAQRLAILQAVTSQPHATADQISDLAVAALGTISRQSVYDSLNTLVEKGVLRRIQPMGSPALYEDRVNDNHHHLICRDCGHVVDVDCAIGMRPCLDAADDHGFEIDEAEVAYWGRCQRCQQTEAPTSRSTTHLSRSN